MSTPYKSVGTPVTPHEREVLEIVQEECAEVIVAVSKILRFGKDDVNPSTGVSNTREFGLEIGDLEAILGVALVLRLFRNPDVMDGRARKYERLNQFMQTKAEDR